MIPNVADFTVYAENQAGNEIQCPTCGNCFIPAHGGIRIRDLIAAASAHAATHAMSVARSRTGA